MNALRNIIFACVVAAHVGLGDEVPRGFEDAGALSRVLSGEILSKTTLDSSLKMQVIFRAYYHGVTPDRFVDVVTDHPHYAQLFSEVLSGKTTKVSADKTEWGYMLKLLVKAGILSSRVTVYGEQKVSPANDLVSEWKFTNLLRDGEGQLKKALSTLRLIPFQNGMLIYSVCDLELDRSAWLFAGTIKQRLRDQALTQLRVFRKEMRAEPR